MAKDEVALLRQAKAVLEFNWTGKYTQPGPRLYPHQWSWGSALVAMGYAHYDQERAEKELRHLLSAQWKNGLLPQIVFNPSFNDTTSPVPASGTLGRALTLQRTTALPGSSCRPSTPRPS